MTVNASACEFMELILKQIEKYHDPNVAYEISHKIIEPLITTFHQCTNKRDQAMQVNILSLLDLILNHGNFQGTKTNNKEKIQHHVLQERQKRCEEILKN